MSRHFHADPSQQHERCNRMRAGTVVEALDYYPYGSQWFDPAVIYFGNAKLLNKNNAKRLIWVTIRHDVAEIAEIGGNGGKSTSRNLG
jgi:hypothetical protein